MKTVISAALSVMVIIVLTACGKVFDSEKQTETSQAEKSQTITQETKKTDYESEAEQKTDTESEKNMDKKILAVYFSCTGTTESLALYATEILNADLYEIIPDDPYTDEALAYYTNGRADREQDDPSVRPAIDGNVENMDEYDTIILGYPIWHGQAPRIISTFLESYDFSDKTIIPFCTSHSSGIGSSDTDLHDLCDANWLPGRRFPGDASKSDVIEWIESLNLEQE